MHHRVRRKDRVAGAFDQLLHLVQIVEGRARLRRSGLLEILGDGG